MSTCQQSTPLSASVLLPSDRLLIEQTRLLEMMLADEPLERCLAAVSTVVSDLDPRVRVCVLVADAERLTFDRVFAPQVAPTFSAGLRGAPINELTFGTCGAAVVRREPVTCEDVATDERWSKEWRALCLAHGILACHSIPVTDGNGRSVASIMLCFAEPASPDPWQLQLAEFASHLAAVAIQRESVQQRQHAETVGRAREFENMQRLQEVSTELIQEDDEDAIFQKLVDAASAILRSDFASLQRLDHERGELQLIANVGFTKEAAEHWEWVRTSSGSSCGEALATGQRVIVPNVETCAFMAGTEDLETYLQCGIRAVQTTPLVSRNGRLLGMMSTHWRQQYSPPEADLRLLDVLARQAADLIDRRRAEHALRESAHMKDELIGLISHEFRNPLVTILGNIDVLHKKIELDEATRDLLIQDLQNDANRLRNLIENMLVLTRPNDPGLALEPMLLQRELPAVVASEQARDRTRVIKLEIRPDLPPVLASRSSVAQILENLLTNARKYGTPGTPIDVTAERREATVVVTVRDRGAEYTEEEVAGFAEPFFRSPTNRDRAGGLGLGMSVCARLAELQGDTLRLRPRDGGGVEASFSLPIADAVD